MAESRGNAHPELMLGKALQHALEELLAPLGIEECCKKLEFYFTIFAWCTYPF